MIHVKYIIIILFLTVAIAGCNTGTTRDFSKDNYESLDIWELSNDETELSLNNYNVFSGGHSLQIINAGCGDLDLKNSFDIADMAGHETDTETGQSYQISVTVKRSATDYDENAPEEPVEDETTALRGEDFSIIIKQGASTLLDQYTTIENDLTWETKNFTFTTNNDSNVYLTFRLGCDLSLFWIDKIEFTYIEPETEEEEE